jgi:hypothetical protein
MTRTATRSVLVLHLGLQLLADSISALAKPNVKQHVYTNNIKAFFDRVPSGSRFTVSGRPVLFFYKSYPLYRNRELLGLLLTKVKEWFIADFGVEPLIVVERDWVISYGGEVPVCNLNDPKPETSTMSAAAVSLVRQKADAFFAWDFVGTPGLKGVTVAGGYPGGGQVETHPLNGVTVGTAGVGYRYCVPFSGPSCTPLLNRERRNGPTGRRLEPDSQCQPSNGDGVVGLRRRQRNQSDVG